MKEYDRIKPNADSFFKQPEAGKTKAGTYQQHKKYRGLFFYSPRYFKI